MSERDLDTLAESYAAAGREELLARFRNAYAHALGTQGDLVSFDAERIEAMVERSAAEADGLQWRRALAGVAARDLGIDLGSALTHPAVTRAHQLSGAPSYESALAALAVPIPTPISAHATVTARPVPAPLTPAPTPTPTPTPTISAEPASAPAAAGPEPVVSVELEPTAVDAGPEPLIPTDPEPAPSVAAPAPAPTPADMPAAGPPAEASSTPKSAATPPSPTIVIPSAIPAPAEPVADSAPESREEVLSHRADDFAAEFMAGTGPSTPSTTEDDPEPAEDPSAAVLWARDTTENEDEVAAPMGGDTFEHEAVPVGGEAAFAAVHLGGVASLPTAGEVDVHLSADGLDLLEVSGEILGRLGWADISALEVTVPHGRRRRKGAPRLVVHTAGGSARFEVPGLSGEELQAQVAPLMDRYGH
ncbi:hypothetical protein [Conexibacter sp. DBS9H8]|uniref:hypothetical protein n=1 Tax=Conexibacter sp. DBS9H8 TaxID=2937801 RepID=UPI00201091FA|nr:hypothetical protein [Conexibacter sp. DBS9H8]